MAIRELISFLPKSGRPVTGERLIGRKKEIERILRDFLLDFDGNNMTIYGLPRIGKTSIVKEVIRRYLLNDYHDKNICPVFLDLNPVKGWSIPQIFYYILNGIWESISECNMDDSSFSYIKETMDEIKEKLQRGDSDSSLVVTTFQNFFLRCQKKGLSLRIILDEYDSIMPTFIQKNGTLNTVGINAFNGAIRNIITEDKYGTRMLFITRNRLSEMEPEGVSSRLTGVCGEPIMIKPFSDDDVEDYWSMLSKYDSEGIITDAHKKIIDYYAGGNYPYWMNLVNSILFEAAFTGERYLDTASKIAVTIRDEYKTVLEMLDASRYLDSGEGSLRGKLMQVVLGINYDVTSADVDRLMSYGVLKKEGETYKAISPFFHDYMDFKNTQTPVWRHLGRFEIAMRMLVKDYIAKNGKTIEDGGFIPAGLMGELKKRRNKMCSNFGDACISHDLVDYFYTSNYFDFFIKPFWGWFKTVFVIFDGNLERCAEQFHYLEQCRNAEGHFNGRFLNKEIVARAEQYCISLSEQAERYLSEGNKM